MRKLYCDICKRELGDERAIRYLKTSKMVRGDAKLTEKPAKPPFEICTLCVELVYNYIKEITK